MPDLPAASTAIDLSRFPPPEVVELISYDAILAALVARLQLLLPSFDATIESDPAVKILQVAAWREMLLRQQFNDRARQVMLAYATGTNLDHLGALVNVERLLVEEADEGSGAPAVYESDTDLRRRIQLAPESFSVAGPASAYVFHALTADPTIAAASATSPEPGQVLVSLLSASGDGTATGDQIAAVEAALGNPIRPLTDQVIVASAEIVQFEVEAELTLLTGPDETVVLAAAQAGLADYLAEARKIGRDISCSGILAKLQVEGVLTINLIQPAADIIISATQCGHCVGSSVIVAGHGD